MRILKEYLSAGTAGGNFPPEKVKNDLVVKINTINYQIRIEQKPDSIQSYAGLYRFSEFRGDWVVITICKPFEDYGIQACGKPFDPDIYLPIINEFLAIAEEFEATEEELAAQDS